VAGIEHDDLHVRGPSLPADLRDGRRIDRHEPRDVTRGENFWGITVTGVRRRWVVGRGAATVVGVAAGGGTYCVVGVRVCWTACRGTNSGVATAVVTGGGGGGGGGGGTSAGVPTTSSGGWFGMATGAGSGAGASSAYTTASGAGGLKVSA